MIRAELVSSNNDGNDSDDESYSQQFSKNVIVDLSRNCRLLPQTCSLVW